MWCLLVQGIDASPPAAQPPAEPPCPIAVMTICASKLRYAELELVMLSRLVLCCEH